MLEPRTLDRFVSEGIGMIELRDVSLRIGKTTILDRISLSIQTGESIAIVGESGAGKTSLGRILLGLVEPSSGQYLHDGKDVFSLRGDERLAWRKDCAAVFQNPTASLNPRIRVDRAITEPMSVEQRLGRQARKGKAAELLERVALASALVDRRPHEMSGGQRQRVVIGRAISTDPKVLILDEPVSGLDVSARAQVLNLLAGLRETTDLTVIYISHDLATIGYLCDRVAVLYRGRLVEDVSVSRMHDGADHPYTRALLDAVIAPDKPISTIRRTSTTLSSGSTACAFAPTCPHVQERCLTVAPDLTEISPGWSSRCHFAGMTKPEASINDQVKS